MGVPKQDLLTVSRLLGTKLVANEYVFSLLTCTKRQSNAFISATNRFVAYASLSTLKTGMTQRGFTIAVYSLCGFANLSSLGIQIGVLGALAPSQRTVITKVGVSALLCGFISTVQSATILGCCCDRWIGVWYVGPNIGGWRYL
jgi:CNT family concentrative nucleoside transporter